MTKDSMIEMLHEKLDSLPQGKEEIDRLSSKFEDDPDASVDALCAWLSASIFYTMTWEKKHREEGDESAAQAEKDRTIVASKALDLLKPYVRVQPANQAEGGI